MRPRTLVLTLALVTGLPAASRAAGIDLSAHRLVDLTHPFDERTLYWPTSPSTFKL